MARRLRYPSLENRTARLKLVVRRKPYPGPTLARGVLLLYRRNKGNGSWVLKASDGRGKYWTKAIGEADDFDASNADTILTFYEAQDTAKQLARGGKGVGAAAPVTVDHALIDYKADLMSRGARGYNADRPRVHLPPLLLAKPVALLTSKELKIWRDGLLSTTESLAEVLWTMPPASSRADHPAILRLIPLHRKFLLQAEEAGARSARDEDRHPHPDFGRLCGRVGSRT